MKGPFKYLNDRFSYPYTSNRAILSFHIPEAPIKVPLSGRASPQRPLWGESRPGRYHQSLDVLEGKDRYGLQNICVVELIFIFCTSFKYHILLSILSYKRRTHFNITCIFIGARLHCTTGKKHSFISWVRPPTHTNPSENGTFRKRSLSRKKLETPVFRFSFDGTHFENELLEIEDVLITMCFPCPSFPLLKKNHWQLLRF